MNTIRGRPSSMWLLSAAAVLAAGAAQAAPAGDVDEIVVSTRYREENLQEVPLAVTAVDEDALQNAGVRSVQDLAKLSPSLSVNESFSQNDLRITVRGLTNTRGRSNVAFLVDGVDVTSETTGTNAGSPLLVNQRLLNDVERVEIVRGPQSALFGRAAFAGAISYVTKEPGDRLEGRVGLEVADYGAYEVNGAVSVPVGETVGLRLNGVLWTEDGAWFNAASGASVGGGEGGAVAGTLLYRPTSDLRIKARVTWSDDDYDIRPVARITDTVALPIPQDAIDNGVLSPATPEPLVVAALGDADGLEVRASEDPLTGGEYPGNNLQVLRGSLLAEWQAGDYVLSAYTGVTDADFTQRYDLDRQAEGRPDLVLAHNDVDTIDSTDQFSQELRVATRWDGPLQATLGGLYWTEERSSLNRNLIVVCSTVEGVSAAGDPGCLDSGYASWQQIYRDLTALDPATRVPTNAETDHWSAYALLEWQATERLAVSIEDRYIDEDFSADLYIGSTCSNFFPDAGPDMTQPVDTDPESPGFNFGCNVVPPQSGTVNTTYHTPKLTLEWQATDDAMLYASAGKGEKPGGISLLTIAAPIPQPFDSFVFEPEEMWAYELGAKTAWEGRLGRLVANAAAFYQDYTDKQVSTVVIPPEIAFPVAVVTNASSAHVLGAELELDWATPLDGLSLGLAYTWLDTEYDDYRDRTRSAQTIAIQGGCPEVVEDAGFRYCVVDYSGNELEYAPEHALAGQVRYRRPLGEGGLQGIAELDARYQDEVYTGVSNFTTQDAWWLVDVRAGLQGDSWRLLAFVNNLLDDDTIRSSGSNPDFGAVAVDAGLPISPQFQTTATLPVPRTFGLRLSYEF